MYIHNGKLQPSEKLAFLGIIGAQLEGIPQTPRPSLNGMPEAPRPSLKPISGTPRISLKGIPEAPLTSLKVIPETPRTSRHCGMDGLIPETPRTSRHFGMDGLKVASQYDLIIRGNTNLSESSTDDCF